MSSFSLAKIKATVATGAMLLPEDQIDKALEDLRANLKSLGLAVLSIERVDASAEKPQPAQPAQAALDDQDPWSFHGRVRD